jgi:mannan endo-1,4-beta-mannosidase
MNYLTSPENNPADNLKEIYTSDYCITLDELPDLKKYPISESSPSTDTPKPVTTQKATSAVTTAVPTTTVITTTASTTKSDIIWGDANGDKDVTLADALLILQNIANSKKYPIEDKYVKQCDVYNSGDGLTPMDALSIQKLDSKLISSLPESIMK